MGVGVSTGPSRTPSLNAANLVLFRYCASIHPRSSTAGWGHRWPRPAGDGALPHSERCRSGFEPLLPAEGRPPRTPYKALPMYKQSVSLARDSRSPCCPPSSRSGWRRRAWSPGGHEPAHQGSDAQPADARMAPCSPASATSSWAPASRVKSPVCLTASRIKTGVDQVRRRGSGRRRSRIPQVRSGRHWAAERRRCTVPGSLQSYQRTRWR